MTNDSAGTSFFNPGLDHENEGGETAAKNPGDGQSFTINHASIGSIDSATNLISATSTPVSAPETVGTNIVLIDTTLPDYQTIADAADENSHVVLYDGDVDSAHGTLSKVVNYSSELGETINSLSIMAHGTPGQIKLGNEWIGLNNLSKYSDTWLALDNVMVDGGNLYLFGCDVVQDFVSGQAFIDELGPQCGFCTPGQIMSAVALLETNPKPTREEARQALSGNLCRCGAYDHYLNSVMRAAEAT